MEQPDYLEPLLHFDQYSVKRVDGEWHVYQMFKNLSWLGAEIVAGVEHIDFCTSIEHTGWIGSCPEWAGFRPVVTIPRGDKLDIDQMAFMMEEIS